jgi:hypothetical protein
MRNVSSSRALHILSESALDSDTLQILLSLKAIHAMLLSEGGNIDNARELILNSESLSNNVKDSLGKCLILLSTRKDFAPSVLQSILSLFATLFVSLGPCLRVLIESFFRYVYIKALHQIVGLLSQFDVVSPDFTNPITLAQLIGKGYGLEELEMILESLADLLADPGFIPSLFASYDCDPLASDIVRPLVHYLCQCARLAISLEPRKIPQLQELSDLCVHCLHQLTRTFSNRCNETLVDALNGSEVAETDGVSIPQTMRSISDSYVSSTPTPMVAKDNHYQSSPPATPQNSSTNLASMDKFLSATSPPRRSKSDTAVQFTPSNVTFNPVDETYFVGSTKENLRDKRSNENDVDCQSLALRSLRRAKELLSEAAVLFHDKPSKGLQFLQQLGALPQPLSPYSVAKFLRIAPGLTKDAVGAFLGELGKDNPSYEADGKSFHEETLRSYVRTFELKGHSVLNCMRIFLSAFRLPGEAQQIDRILVAFSEYCHTSCIEGHNGLLENPEVTYLLTFSIIMLNTDRHNPNIRADRRMTMEQFVRNNTNYGADVKQTKSLPRTFLEEIYQSISDCPIRTETNDHLSEFTIEVWTDLQTQCVIDPNRMAIISCCHRPAIVKAIAKSCMIEKKIMRWDSVTDLNKALIEADHDENVHEKIIEKVIDEAAELAATVNSSEGIETQSSNPKLEEMIDKVEGEDRNAVIQVM